MLQFHGSINADSWRSTNQTILNFHEPQISWLTIFCASLDRHVNEFKLPVHQHLLGRSMRLSRDSYIALAQLGHSHMTKHYRHGLHVRPGTTNQTTNNSTWGSHVQKCRSLIWYWIHWPLLIHRINAALNTFEYICVLTSRHIQAGHSRFPVCMEPDVGNNLSCIHLHHASDITFSCVRTFRGRTSPNIAWPCTRRHLYCLAQVMTLSWPSTSIR